MALSMRERTTEIAVLKAIGFRSGLLLCMVLGESVIIALVGGLLGVSSGRGIYALAHQAVPQMFPLRSLPWDVMAYGLAIAAAIGLASGMIPAVLAARLSVVNGLRKVV
jgi:putative ABC transport system permease protein